MFANWVQQAPSCPVTPVPKYAGNSHFSVFRQKFELAIKMNGWTYLEVANHILPVV